MPKSIIIDPKQMRKPDKLKIKPIPINQYQADIEKEIKIFSEEGLKQIYYYMLLIREFESMLNSIKTQGVYNNIQYNHLGPAHLSIGQEAAAVGLCAHLDKDDFIFGSHRSHGEILAKCLSAAAKMDQKNLLSIMESYLEGDCLKTVEQIKHNNTNDLAENFILFGTLAEIFAKNNGFNRGMGGSMHAFFAPLGSMPNNAIVGGSGDICVGAALFKRINRKPGIVIGSIGDASMGCGPVWEGMMLAAMDQYTTLWPKKVGGAPPLLFNFMNNFYGMGGQPYGETMGFHIMARVGAGVNPQNMHAERVDGYNPLAVADAVQRKKAILLKGKGPALLDTITYRFSGHSPSDASSYRSKEELQLWQQVDCIEEYSAYLIKNNILTQSEKEKYRELVKQKITGVLRLAISPDISPRANGAFIESVMFSHQFMDKIAEGKPQVLIPQKENPRVKAIAGKYRYALDENRKPYPKLKLFSYRDALFEAMLHRFYEDATMVAYGEENREWGGAFAVYRGLTEALPYHRLFNAPISEGAIVGSGVGYALCGGRAVVELMYCDFLGRAGDEVFNQVAKWQAMSAGFLKMPLVIRISVGNKYGAQHSQDWSSLLAHIPGLKVMYPATPYDAKGMLNLALRGTDPVVFFESQKLYGVGELFAKEGVPTDYYEIKTGEPSIKRQGKNITIITIGPALYTTIEVADDLEQKYSLSCEVIDLRFINPLNYDKIIQSVKKTGRVLLVSDACERGSFLHNVAARITEAAFDYLDAPPVVIGSRNWITPAAEMESLFFPQKEWIIDAIHERLYPLKGYNVKTNQTQMEMLRREREGV